MNGFMVGALQSNGDKLNKPRAFLPSCAAAYDDLEEAIASAEQHYRMNVSTGQSLTFTPYRKADGSGAIVEVTFGDGGGFQTEGFYKIVSVQLVAPPAAKQPAA